MQLFDHDAGPILLDGQEAKISEDELARINGSRIGN